MKRTPGYIAGPSGGILVFGDRNDKADGQIVPHLVRPREPNSLKTSP